MEFRRINSLPPYVFATINDLRDIGRREGRDVIDMGFGNPDLPSPDVAVEKLAEAVRNPRNHRYSASRGIPKIRQAIADLYLRKFEVELDPDTEVVTTIGAKEGLSHLMWVLVGPGDTALVPSPSYPIHIYAPLFAGADIRHVRLDAPGDATSSSPGEAFFDNLMEDWESAWPKPRVVVPSFPHNPTTGLWGNESTTSRGLGHADSQASIRLSKNASPGLELVASPGASRRTWRMSAPANSGA